MKKKANSVNSEKELCLAVAKYATCDNARFHTPGHKGNCKMAGGLSCGKIDVTELSFSDNLFSSGEKIGAVERGIARLFGVRRSLVLTQGSTCGNHIMLGIASATGGDGCKILITKGCHASVYGGIEILGLTPVFLDCGGSGVSADALDRALANDGDIRAVLLTYPDALGAVFDVSAVSAVIKRHERLFFIDGAWSGYCGFDRRFPQSPARYADATVVSLHKNLPAMTGAAALLFNDDLTWRFAERERKRFHSTSPSYPVLCSVEYCVKRLLRQIKNGGVAEFADRAEELALRLVLAGAEVFTGGDMTKLVLRLPADRTAVADFFESRGIYPESVSGSLAVFALSLCDKKSWYDRLERATAELYRGRTGKTIPLEYRGASAVDAVVSYSDAVRIADDALLGKAEDAVEYSELFESVGRITLENLGIYPPGTPLAVRGERLSADVVGRLLADKDAVFGVKDGKVAVMIEKKIEQVDKI